MSEEGVFGKLLIIYPDKSRREVAVSQPEFRIGSDPQNELVVAGPGIGKCQVILRSTPQGGIVVVSAAADTPVVVNQQSVPQKALAQGDVITVGPFNMVYHRPGALNNPSASHPPPVAPVPQPSTAPGADAADARGGRATDIPGGGHPDAAPMNYPSGALRTPPGAFPGIQTPSGVAFVVYSQVGTFSYPLQVDKSVRLGAAADNDVSITFAPGVKPLHARLEWHGERAVLVDPDGRAEVFVNGQPENRRELNNGDFVKLGEARLVYHDTRSLEGGRMALKHTVSGNLSRQTLGQVVKLGRDPGNDIVLNHLQVSRYHAEIQKRSEGFYLVDLGSTNGTFLNGSRIKDPQPLHKDDRIRISDFSFFFDGTKLEHYSEEGNARIDAINLRRIVSHNKVILHDISLSIYPREFVALVGVSGAGKSTLMNALSGFRPADQGTVLLNGIDYYAHFDTFRSTLGYVPQDDIIHKELTVYRALYYAACLRMPEDTSSEEIHRRLEEVMKDLHLTERRDTPISRLSGGQRKRVSIGVELLTRPRLFYLDEPTSGLDPGMETEMMRIFRNLADKGHTLVLVTHATKNIMLCDKVIFLAEGGHLAFYGSPSEALQHFGTNDFTDIYLKLENEKSPEIWDKEYRASPYYQRNVVDRLQEVNALVQKAKTQEQHDRQAHKGTQRQSPPLRQFSILTARYLEIMFRDTGNLGILLGSAVVIALILAFLFPSNILTHFSVEDYNIPGVSHGTLQLGDMEGRAFQARLMTFFLMMAPIFFGVSNAIRELAKEIPIYKRERTVNLQILPYIGSKVVVLSLICLIQVLLLELVIGLRFKIPGADASFYLRLFLVLLMGSLAAMSMGLSFSAFASNENKAASALSILLLPQLFLTGSLPKLEWPGKIVTYFGLTKWAYELLGNLTQIWRLFPSQEDISTHPQLASLLQKFVDQGQEYRDALNIQYWRHLGLLGLFFVVFIALACTFQLGKDDIKR